VKLGLNYPNVIIIGNKIFQEEYLELLEKQGIEYDERYLWG